MIASSPSDENKEFRIRISSAGKDEPQIVHEYNIHYLTDMEKRDDLFLSGTLPSIHLNKVNSTSPHISKGQNLLRMSKMSQELDPARLTIIRNVSESH